jgi:WD40 repeat protein
VGSIESQIVSGDQKRMVVLAVDRVQNVFNFWLVNTESKENTKIAEATFVSGDQYELIGFAKDYSKYLYRKTDANKAITYVVAESKMGGLTYNLDTLFSNQASKYYFSPYNNNELFFVQNSSVFKINLENKTESSVLATDVVTAHALKDEFLLVRKTEENYGLWVLGSNNELKNVAKAVPAADDYRVAYLETSKSYLIQELGDRDLLIYSNEIKNPTLETIAHDVNLFSVSPTGERVAFYSENKLRVYSIKEEKYFDIADSDKINSIDWMQDGKNLIYGAGTEIRIVNYNGDYNKAMFTAQASGTVLSPDNSYNIFFFDSVSEDRDLYSFSL